MQEREQLFISPEDQEKKQRQRRNNEEASSSNEENSSTQELVQRFKEKHDNLQKKRRASEISQGKGFTPDDFIHKKRKH
jgi:K+-transporting ATPase c subunit